jgi:hypothetical protein
MLGAVVALAAAPALAQPAQERTATHGVDCAGFASPELQRHCVGARGGDPVAMAAFGNTLYFGDGGPVEPAAAVRLWRAAAERGVARADFMLGLGHAFGWAEFERDVAVALRHLRLSGEGGYRNAWYQLAQLRLLATHPPDQEGALEAARRGADLGDHASLRLLGWMYDNGVSVARNEAEALRLWRLAANGTDSETYYHLGRYYRYGIATARDEATAILYLRIAAGLGHIDAQVALGNMLLDSQSMFRSVEEGFAWLRRAVADGMTPQAHNALAWRLALAGTELDEALAAARRAANDEPYNASFLDTLAWVHHRRGDHRAALEMQLQAVEIMSSDWPMQARLGDILAALGQVEEARAAWRRAIELGRGAPDAPDALTSLQELERRVAGR